MAGVRWRAANVAIAIALGLVGTAHADNFQIPAGRLGDVAAALGVQVGVTITVTEPEIARQHSPGVSGELSLREALDRVLRGTDAEARFYDQTTIQIVRKTAQAPPQPPAAANNETLQEVVVTASKQQIPLTTYPGSVKVVELQRGWTAQNAAGGTAAITQLLPSLSSTNLGPGRDKLFIRGLADSSFSGQTEATAGEYLGDVRLNYNAPDPDLNLYDMQRVEVLVGPQGTLYGAGSLGGIIRLVPNEPDSEESAATASAGMSSTESGGISRDGAAMFNAPLLRGQVALRVVAYGARDGGYIDDLERDLHDINTTSSYGQRLTLRVASLPGWTLDFGVVLQTIHVADAQYSLSDSPPLSRSSTLAQPFGSQYLAAYISGRRTLDRVDVVSTTSSVWQSLDTVYDATGYDGSTAPARFKERDDITLISHETRVAGRNEQMPWVTGFTTLFSTNMLSRTLGSLDTPVQITGVANVQAEAAIFGQISHSLTRTLTGTIGERLTFANSTGFLTSPPTSEPQTVARNSVHASNTLALDWHPGGVYSAFFHYQQGYRAGGLAVAPSGSTSSGSAIAAQKFVSDDLNMDEIGLRLGREAQDPLWLRAALFAADWNHMQADLIDTAGLPYSTNIGRGRIYGADADLTWRPWESLTLNAGALLNVSKLVSSDAQFSTGRTQTLPNVARAGGRLGIQWQRQLPLGALSAEGAMRYVGRSTLGVGPLLDIPQGNYFVTDAQVRLDMGTTTLSLSLNNVSNVRANTFAFGDPFGIAKRNQMTPLQPRTVRLGTEVRF